MACTAVSCSMRWHGGGGWLQLKRISFMLLCLLVIAAGISGCSLSGQPREEKTTLGVWWWGTGNLANETEFNRRLQFLREHNVTEVYLTYDPNMDDERFHNALRSFTAAGIRTSALNGDASWVTEAGYASYVAWLGELQAYQDNAKEDEKFRGLHIDVEPHALPEYQADPAPFLPVYMKLVDTTAAFTKKNKMTSEFDVPFWYDKDITVTTEDGEMVMVEYIIKNIDTIAIMSYRDTAMGQYLASMDVIALIKQHGKKAMLGSETQPIDETPYITYFEEGPEAMDAEMVKLRALLQDTMGDIPFGLAVHHMDSWIDWPS